MNFEVIFKGLRSEGLVARTNVRIMTIMMSAMYNFVLMVPIPLGSSWPS